MLHKLFDPKPQIFIFETSCIVVIKSDQKYRKVLLSCITKSLQRIVAVIAVVKPTSVGGNEEIVVVQCHPKFEHYSGIV